MRVIPDPAANGARAADPAPLRLAASPWRFDFFAAVRWIETRARHRPRVGAAARHREEAVLIGQAPSMSFAPAALSAARPPEGDGPWRLWQRFFGLWGPNGPMPLHLTEQVRERARRRPPDDAWCAFADLFHHRTACLLYRAWSEAEPAVGADRASPGPWGEPDDPFGARLAALGGARPSDRPIHAPDGAGGRSGSDGESGGESEGDSDGEGAGPGDRKGDRDGTPSSLALSPMLAAWPAAGARSADAIEQVASAVLGDRVRVRAPVVQWLSVPQGERCRLGHPGRASQLGGGAVLGARLRDAASTVRIEVGPVTPARWRQLREPAGRRAGGASGGASGGAWASPAARLRLCVRRLVDPRLVVDLRVRLAASDVPEARLSRHDADGPRLGRSAWLSRRASHDADDLRWRLR